MAEVVRLVDAEARLRRARRRGLVQSERLPSVRVRSASFAHAPRPCLRPGPQPHAHLPGHEAQPGPGYYGNSDRAVMGQKNRTFDCQPSFDSPALSGQLGSPMSEGRSALTDRACSLRNRIAKLADAEDSKGTARLNLTQDRFYDQFENTTKTPGPGSYNWSNANITT